MTDTTESTITIADYSGATIPLYLHYDGQCAPQPAYVEMDEGGAVTADSNGEIGNGVPMYVWHNRTLRWDVCNRVTGAALTAALESLRPEFAAVHAGHSVDWDGNNYVGTLTEAADAAYDRIQQALEALEGDETACVSVWSANDWVHQCGERYAVTFIDGGDRARSISTCAEESHFAADDCNAVIDGGEAAIADVLIDWLEEDLAQSEPESWNEYVRHYRAIQLLNDHRA